jgi:hypothetical protein
MLHPGQRTHSENAAENETSVGINRDDVIRARPDQPKVPGDCRLRDVAPRKGVIFR